MIVKDKSYTFTRLFWLYTLGCIPFVLFVATLVLLELMPINFNDKPEYGIKGFFLFLMFIPMIGMMLTCVNWMFLNVGNYLYKKTLKLRKRDEL